MNRAQFLPVDRFDPVVFGGTGDLAMRKLLPGLYHRDSDAQIPPDSWIIGIARKDLAPSAYADAVRETLGTHIGEADLDRGVLDRFMSRISYVQIDALGEDGWQDIADTLSSAPDRVRVFYLATASDLFGPISERLAARKLVTPNSRVVLEKPLGHDLTSAEKINFDLSRVFGEEQIFRIDHYLGKETVQNLITLRFANLLFEPLWNSAAIGHVQITVSETLGVGGRADYYDRFGALRDMVQNHILQLLCLVAMERPASLDAAAVRDEKLKVLRSLRPIGPAQVRSHTVRGQYRPGAVDGVAVAGYPEEVGDADSATETFVAIKAEIDNWRWTGVPFYLRTGKRIAARYPDAYERLLMDVVRGNATLFMRRDEQSAAWQWIDPIIAGWRQEKQTVRPYTAGSWGPSVATAPIVRDGRCWFEDAA